MLELVRRCDINKCSFRFVVENDEWIYADAKNDLQYDERTILMVAMLKEVELVVFPAYKDTGTIVRYLEERMAAFI